MKRLRDVALLLGTVTIIIMCLFPPWVYTAKHPRLKREIEKPAGYQFILRRNDLSDAKLESVFGDLGIDERFVTVDLDVKRLAVQILAAILAFGLAAAWAQSRVRPKPPRRENDSGNPQDKEGPTETNSNESREYDAHRSRKTSSHPRVQRAFRNLLAYRKREDLLAKKTESRSPAQSNKQSMELSDAEWNQACEQALDLANEPKNKIANDLLVRVEGVSTASIYDHARKAASAKWAMLLFASLLLVPAGLYTSWAYYRTERNAQELEKQVIVPETGGESISEVGYVLESRTARSLWEKKKDVIWWVKISTTNKVWSCDWQAGFAGFNENDPVRLVHTAKGLEDDDWDGYGYIIGMHDAKKDKVALVWALDVDELEMMVDH